MKKAILIFGLLIVTLFKTTAQISRTDLFDATAFRVSEGLNFMGSTIPSIIYPELDQIEFDGAILLPAKQVCYLVPSTASDFKLEVTTDKESLLELDNNLDTTTLKINELGNLSSPYGESNNPHVTISGVGYLSGKYKVVTLLITPCTITADLQKISIAENLKANLTWVEQPAKESESIITNNPKLYKDVSERLEILVENPTDLTKYYGADNIMPISEGREGTNEYAIVTPRRFIEYLRPLEAIWTNKGYTTQIYALEDILSSSAGDPLTDVNDNASKLRNFIRNQYTVNGLQYLLLAGKYPEMPIRYVDITNSKNGIIPSDSYFEDLNTSWVKTSYGFKPKNDQIDKIPEVYIGRLPVDSPQDIRNYIEKMYIYEYQYDKTDLSYLGRGLITREDNSTFRNYTVSNLQPLFDLFQKDCVLDISAWDNENVNGNYVIKQMNQHPAVLHDFMGHGNPSAVTVKDVWRLDDWNDGKGLIMRQYSYGLVALDEDDWHQLDETGNGLDNLTNFSFPSWSFSCSCSLMPFDEYDHYSVKLNFGESYIIGGLYGGVLFFGNTRDSYVDLSATTRFYRNVKNANDQKNYKRGVIGSEIRDLSKTTSTSSYDNNFYTKNIFGDPLTTLWTQVPERPEYNITTIDNVRRVNIKNGFERYYIGYNNLNIQGFSDFQEFYDEIPGPPIYTNVIMTVYGKNIVPEILPVYLQNFTFNSGTQNTLVVKDLYARSDLDSSIKNGNIIFESNADVTIEALGSVDLDYGTIFKSGSNLKIRAKGQVFLGHLNVPAGATLYVEASKIVWPEDHVTFASSAKVTLIENGRQVYPKSGKALAKARGDVHDPMVVEGRTWWYNAPVAGLKDQEFGFRIAAPTVIEGETWYPVQQIKYYVSTPDSNTLYDDISTICHIRQEGSKIYTRLEFDSELGKHPLYEQFFGPCQHIENYDEVSIREFELYGNEGDEFIYTSDNDCTCGYAAEKGQIDFLKYKFEKSETITNSDRQYQRYVLSHVDHQCAYSFFPENTIYSIPEFGYTDPKGYLSELFFTPLGTQLAARYPSQENPKLRYVTDENNDIIYEAMGGFKLWEYDPAGVDVTELNFDAEPEIWYTIDGCVIEAPNAPGLYIKRKGQYSEKVIIR